MDLATMAHPTTVGMGMGPVGKLSPTSPPGAAGPLLSLIYPPRRGLPATRALQASLSNDSQPSRHRRSSAEWAVSMSRFAGINYAAKPQRQTAACSTGGVNSAGNVVNAADIERPPTGLAKTALLGLLFAGWYIFNIYFNIYNKQVLKVFPFPITCTNLQFFVGSAIVLAMWGLRLHRVPRLNKETVLTILPLAVVHTLGNLLTNVSLGQVAVSFTHTIKAMEPFFSVALSAVFLGDIPSVKVLLTLVPIVGGVACASLSEPTFNWAGFAAAMGSNLTFQSRNVLSKKLMKDVGNIDNINLFSIITLMSSVLLIPVTLLTEGFQLTASNMASMGILDPNAIIAKAVAAGLCFHLYQQVSYMILSRVSPVTHSIGNCVKRVVVIIASVIVFANPVTQQNAIGTTIALLGVFAYSQVKRGPTKKSNTK